MGKRGPAPKPVELRVLEGNRGHRPLGSLDATFRPEVGAPTPPNWLSKEALKRWRALMPELLRYNVISKLDRDRFAMLCQAIGRVEIAERSLQSAIAAHVADGKDPVDAMLDYTPSGRGRPNGRMEIIKSEREVASKLMDEFGLSPAQRARVATAVRQQLTLFEGGRPSPGGSAPTGFADFQ